MGRNCAPLPIGHTAAARDLHEGLHSGGISTRPYGRCPALRNRIISTAGTTVTIS
jgi:hypothetical protein